MNGCLYFEKFIIEIIIITPIKSDAYGRRKQNIELSSLKLSPSPISLRYIKLIPVSYCLLPWLIYDEGTSILLYVVGGLNINGIPSSFPLLTFFW